VRLFLCFSGSGEQQLDAQYNQTTNSNLSPNASIKTG
jgi:hypothetical protein